MKRRFFALLVLFASLHCAQAKLKLPGIFQDQMVLQREKPLRFWGQADANQSVTLSFDNHKQTATAAGDGRWELQLPPLGANAVGQSLTVTAGEESLELKDVLVGEVWICGGQSNMAWNLRGSRDADLEISGARFPQIRFVNIEPRGLAEPQEDFSEKNPIGEWQICSPETAGECSGVAYYFAKRLHFNLDVPIGFVNAAWGGTMAQHWVTRETLETLPAAKKSLDDFDAKRQKWIDQGGAEGAKERFESDLSKWEVRAEKAKASGEKQPGGKPNPRSYGDPREGRLPGGAMNAMILPLKGLTVRGALFYQGENNSFGDAWMPFVETFPAVIRDWRKVFRDENLPFGIIQIAGWSTRRSMTYDMNHHTNIVREVQFQTWKATPQSGLIVSFDANSNASIHPGNKGPVGARSARWALAEVYGAKDATRDQPLKWHGPVYRSIQSAKGKIVVNFEESGAEGLRLDKSDARGFYIAGTDQIFHHAEARVISGKNKEAALEVWSDQVAEPVAVRYAWSNLPLGSLMNGKELPAYPFRSDDWPLKPHGGSEVYQMSKK